MCIGCGLGNCLPICYAFLHHLFAVIRLVLAKLTEMGRAPCCDKMGLKKGPWTPDEDRILVAFIRDHGHGNWRALPKQAGLLRCGKSCRLRWTNYLRPDIKRGNFSTEEENTIMELHNNLGNRWSIIASRLPGRTDNEIKNYWNTHLKKRLPEHMVNTKTASKKRSKQDLMKQSMVDASSDFPSYPFRQDASTVSSSETKGNQASDAWFEDLSSFESRLSGSSSCSDFSMESEASLGISSSSSSAFMNETAVPSDLFAEGDDISLHSISNLQTLDFFSVEANPVCDFPALQGIDEIKPEFRQEEDNSGFEDLLKSDSEGVDFWRQVLREVDVANAFPSFE